MTRRITMSETKIITDDMKDAQEIAEEKRMAIRSAVDALLEA